MRRCLIIGAGTYGQTFSFYLNQQDYQIIGYLDDNVELHGKMVSNIKVLGNIDLLYNPGEIAKDVHIFCPIGNNDLRVNILKRARKMGYATPSFIHSSVCAGNAEIGTGVYILPGVHLMPYVRINDYCIISMGSNVAHHSTLHTGCFVSTGVNIGANIELRENCFIGIGATVTTGINYVGENALVGSGAVVIKNVEPDHVVAGVPARVIRIKSKPIAS